MSVYAASAQSQPGAAAAAQQQQQQQQQQRHQRLNDLLEHVKQEFEYAYSESSNFSKVKEDYDLKCNQQTAEMQQIRQTVYELEMAHRKIKEAYEEEILRLKTELENRDRQAHAKQNNGSNLSGSAGGVSSVSSVGAVGAGAPHGYGYQPQALPQPGQEHVISGQGNPAQAPGVMSGHIQVPGHGPGQNPPAPVQTQAHQQQQQQQQQQAQQAQQAQQVQQAQQPPMIKHHGAKPEIKQSPVPPKIEPVQTQPLPGHNQGGQAAESSLTIIDKSQPIVNPADKNLHVKEIPAFLSDLDVAKANPDFKKQTPEFYVLYNPALRRELDVDLMQSLDHSSVVCCVKFSKNGEFVATGCNKTTQVFDVKTGQLVAKLIDDNSGISSEIDGESGSSAENGNAGANGATNSSAANANGDLYIRSVCFSPDGKLLATGAEDKLIRIWNLQTKRIIKILRGHEQDIYSLDFFPDGERLVSGSGDRTVRIWDLRSSQCSLTLSIEDGVTTVAVSPNGKLIAAGSLDKTVRVWDSSTGFLVERLDSGNESGNGHQDSVYSVAFSTNGHQLASGSLDRTVKLWNLAGKADAGSIGGTSNGQSTGKKSVCEVTYVGHKDFVLSVCSTPDSEYILSGSKDRGVVFWDQNSGNPLLMLQGHRNSVISVAVSLNSSATEGVFATGSGDCKARLWRWRRN